MSNKRKIVRIGSVLACLLLACLFVVPAFADDNFEGNITDDYYSVFINTNIPDIFHDKDVLMYLIDSYRNGTVKDAGLDGLFGCSLLCYSSVTYDAESSRPAAFGSEYKLGDDTVIKHQVNLEFITMDVTLSDTTLQPLRLALDNARFDFLLCAGDDISVEITLTGYWQDRDEIIHESMIVFRNIRGTYSSDQVVTLVGLYECEYYVDGHLEFVSDATKIETAYTVKNYLVVGSPYTSVGVIQTFLLSENQTTYYHPLAFANGYFGGKMMAPTYEEGFTDGHDAGYQEGKDKGFADGLYQGFQDGEEQGYVNGFGDGIEEGLQHGYANGYNVGYQEGYVAGGNGNSEEAYQDGYDAAVEDIDSGDFGRNLLGGMFSAPMDALNSFTLVSWELSNGGTVSITLGAIISAILGVVFLMWFLKLFAGG